MHRQLPGVIQRFARKTSDNSVLAELPLERARVRKEVDPMLSADP